MKCLKLKPAAFLLVALLGVGDFNAGWAKPTEEKVKEFFDEASAALKDAVDKAGDNVQSVQDYLDQYHWKGMLQDPASAGAVTLKSLRFNDHSKVVVVKPGQEIDGFVKCELNPDQVSPLKVYRVVLGIKGEGPQTTIGNELGLVAGKSKEKFKLTAPTEPGMYQVRFRLVEAVFESSALDEWIDENGHEPDATTTIGIIYVKA